MTAPTDRIEVIRPRHAARLRTRVSGACPPSADDDTAVLLEEVARRDKVLEEVRDALRFDSGLWDEDARGEAVEALEREMGTDWLHGRAEEPNS